MNDVADMKIVVTGGASGIGLATASLLRRRGANVLIVDLDPVRVETTLGELAVDDAPGLLAGFAMDVRSADDCERMMVHAEQTIGAVDALIHCAGILRLPGSRPRPAHELDVSEYEAVVDTNLKGTFLVNQAALRRFVPRRAGQIVNLSSTSGLKGRAFDSVYSASKAGVIGLSQSIAEEVRAFGVRVQVVTPDAVDTPLWRQNGPVSAAPQGSLPPERVAEAILMCVQLPLDTVCENLVLSPMRVRTRRKRADAG